MWTTIELRTIRICLGATPLLRCSCNIYIYVSWWFYGVRWYSDAFIQSYSICSMRSKENKPENGALNLDTSITRLSCGRIKIVGYARLGERESMSQPHHHHSNVESEWTLEGDRGKKTTLQWIALRVVGTLRTIENKKNSGKLLVDNNGLKFQIIDCNEFRKS